jgi:pyruvate/2-oxoglutarate dehydrogenase complex dihydrolipoamide acyltransferase (E2) component
MGKILEVRIPKCPECWESCGSCGSGKVIVDDVQVFPGDLVERDQTLIVLETGKVALDIPSPAAGLIVELLVAPGDSINECQVFMTLEIDT